MISILIIGTDNGKVSVTVIKTNKHLHDLQLGVMENGDITSNELNKQVLLHLNKRISSNKCRVSNKRRTFGYQYRNKCLPLLNAFPLLSAAPLNTTFIRIATIFY